MLYCPNCKKSHFIHFYAGGVTGTYKCDYCGYLGPVILERGKRKRVGKKTVVLK